MADINVISSFKVNNPAPADAKYLVANVAGIQSIIDAGNAYVGMQCYNQAEDKLYIVYQDGEVLKYKELLGGTSADISDIKTEIGTKAVANTAEEGQPSNAVEATGMYEYIDDSIKDAVEALDAEVTSEGGARVAVKVTEVDGKITAVNVTENDIAQKSELDKLIALHAAGTHDGYATVAEEVAKIVDGAPEAFDTLKEIADWIDKNANGNEADGFDAATKITQLLTDVGAKNTAAEGTASNATGLFKYVDDAVAAANSSADDAIKALDATVYGSMTADGAVREGQKVGVKVVEEDGKLTSVVVATQDIASAALLGTASDDKTKATAFGAIAAEADARATAISNLDADFTGDKAVSDTDGFVTVGLKEEDGVITALTVASNDIARASELSALSGVVGKATVTGESAADGTGLIKRIEDLETKTTGDSVATQIQTAVEALDADVNSADNADAAAGKGTNVNVEVVEADGKITAVKVTESDIASAALLGTAADTKTANTAFGKIAAEADRAATKEGEIEALIGTVPTKVGETDTTTVVAYVDAKVAAAASDANSDIEALEALHAKDGDDFKSVATEIEEAINALGGSATSTNGTLVNVTVTTVDGEVNSVSVDDSALTTKIGTVPAKVGETAVSDVVGYVDAKVAASTTAADEAVKALDATVRAQLTDADAIDDNAHKVGVKIVETDGKLTSVTVVENDIASASALSDLVGLVGASEKGEGESSIVARLGVLEGSKTTEGSVAYQIAQVVANAPTDFDTLKEIADWIANDTTGAASMANDIDTLKTTVGKEAVAASEGVEASDATGLIADVRALEAKMGTTDVAAQITTAINALDADIKSADVDANKGTFVNVEVVEADGKVTAVKVTESDIASAALVGTIPEGATATTVVGYAKEVADAAEAAANGYTDSAIAALDAAKTSTDGGDIAVKVTEVDGVITAVNVTNNYQAYTASEVATLWANTPIYIPPNDQPYCYGEQ